MKPEIPPQTDRAVIYCRVSSIKQVEEGHGLDSQEVRCREYAKRKDYAILEVFADKGVSGGDLDRPEMRNMLSFLLSQPDKNTAVIIDDLNRFSRDVRVHWQLRDLVKNAGGILESPTLKFGDTSDDKLIENLLASVSQHQREKNGEQVNNRMRARVMNGYAVVSRIIGYKYKQTSTEGKVLVRDEPIASILQQALEGYTSGHFNSQTEVQRFLESQPDFPKQNPQGGIRLWKITQMLKQPLYAGYIQSKAWGVSLRPARHEGLISFETYQKIQKRLKATSLAPARKDIAQDFPLRGFVTCGDCGKPFRSCRSKGEYKRYAYYLCHTKGCESYGKSIARDKVEGEFADLLKDLQPSRGLFALVKALFTQAWNQRLSQANEMRKAMRRDLLKLEKQIDGFLEKIVETTNARVVQAYEHKIDQLERQKLLTSEKLEKSFKPQAKASEMLELSLRFLSSHCKIWTSGNIHLQKLVLRLAFSERLAYHRNEGYRTPKTTLPFSVLGGICTHECKMVPLSRETSNELFEVFEDWDHQLRQADIDFEELLK